MHPDPVAPDSRAGPAHPRFWPAANAGAAFVLLGFIAIELLGDLASSRALDYQSLHDFLSNLLATQATLEALEYAPRLYYPPPFLVFQDALWKLGLPGAALVGLSLLAASAFASPFLCLDCVGLEGDRRRGVLAVVVTLAVVYYVQWNLRAANYNQLFLVLALASLLADRRERPGLAGFLLACSIALKLYSVLLLPYLLWRREARWLVWTGGWLALLFIALPILWFGPGDALLLTSSWLDVIFETRDPLDAQHFYKSLERTLLLALTEAGVEGGAGASLAQLDVGVVRLLTRGIWLAWISAVAIHLYRGRGDSSGERRFLDVAALLLLSLCISPTFQAHHGVVCMMPAAWGVCVAVDERESRGRRVCAVAILAGAALLVVWAPGGLARTFATHVALALYLTLILVLPPRAMVRAGFDAASRVSSGAE